MSDTPIDTERLRALLAADTAGPIEVERDVCDCGGGYPCAHGEFAYALRARSAGDYEHLAMFETVSLETADLIAEARNALPALLDEVDHRRSLLACLREFARDVVWLDASASTHTDFGAAVGKRVTRLLADDLPSLPGNVTLAGRPETAATPNPDGGKP